MHGWPGQVETINLKGLDRVVFVSYLPGDAKRVLFRQYSVKYKKSGEDRPAPGGHSIDSQGDRGAQKRERRAAGMA